MADPETAGETGGVDPPRLRAGRYYTEAELARAAREAIEGATNRDGSPLTQSDVARELKVSQSLVSQATRYDEREGNRQRGHQLRRLILRRWGNGGSLRFAGPFWLAVGPNELGEDDGSYPDGIEAKFAPGEAPALHGNGTVADRNRRRSERANRAGV